MKKILICGICLAVSLMVSGSDANLIVNEDAENGKGKWGEPLEIASENPHSGAKCFMKAPSKQVGMNEFIEIDSSKKYDFSGWFKAGDDQNGSLYIALIPFDKNKNKINGEEVFPLKGTETELVERCVAGDTELKIKDGSKWKIDPVVHTVAFEIDGSGKYEDLPNKKIANGRVISVEKDNDVWIATLDKPCGLEFQKGTKIRQHIYGPYYVNPLYVANFNSKEWIGLSCSLQGIEPVLNRKVYPMKAFWPGTKYIKLAIVYPGKLYFDDITFKESATKQ